MIKVAYSIKHGTQYYVESDQTIAFTKIDVIPIVKEKGNKIQLSVSDAKMFVLEYEPGQITQEKAEERVRQKAFDEGYGLSLKIDLKELTKL